MFGRKKLIGALLSSTVALMMFAVPMPTALSVSLTVNSTGDAQDLNPGDGLCLTGGLNSELDQECTLRAAIQEANSLGGGDAIGFAIPVTDPGHSASPLSYTIRPGSALPQITGPTSIDGTSQPDHTSTPIIVIDGAGAGTVDGLFISSNNSTIHGLVVIGFGDEGIEIIGNNNSVTGSYVGVDAAGTGSIGNDDGILIRGDNNTVGGPGGANRVVVSGNADEGVSIDGGDGNTVTNTYVGTDAPGTGALPNAGNGIAAQFGAAGNVIGPNNVISGNGLSGVLIDGAGSNNTIVVSNRIGLVASGSTALGNHDHGVHIRDSANNSRIGGAGEGNVISANGAKGIYIEPGAEDNTIRENLIGTDATGMVGRGNGDEGGYIDADDALIIDNLISDNGSDGLRVERQNAIIRGNLIGTDVTGGPLGNGGDGIDTGSGTGGTQIGGTGAGHGNTIAYNAGRGVSLRQHPGTTAAILGNSIHHNGLLGIDLLADGVSHNDLFDIDWWPPNDMLNFPALTSAAETAGIVDVDYFLDVPTGWYRIEFFTNPNGVDGSSYGEGEVPVGSMVVGHSGLGPRHFSFSYPGFAGDRITATTTECTSSACTGHTITSEFSRYETATHVNSAPTLGAIGNKTVDEEIQLAFTATATDPDPGDTLTFTLEDGPGAVPSGAAITSTGSFTWTPTEAQGPGIYTFDVVVTDDGTPNRTDRETITVTVNEDNRAPVVSGSGNQANSEGDTVNLAFSATDADLPSNIIAWTATGLPPGLTVDPVTGVVSGTIDYTASIGSPYWVTVTATDSGSPNLSGAVGFSWMVADDNQRPVLDPVGNHTVAESTEISFTATASDADVLDTLTFSLADGPGQVPAGASIDPDTGFFSWTPQEGQGPGSYTFNVMVTDDGSPNRRDRETITITVNEVNRAPVLGPISDRKGTEGETIFFNATATDPDRPDNHLIFRLEHGSGHVPPGASIDPTTGVFTWSPRESDGPGSYTFDVVVVDDGVPSAEDRQSVTVIVEEVNRGPSIDHLPNRSDTERDDVDIVLGATDPDKPANTLSWTATGLPPGVSIDPATGRITGTIRYSAGGGSPYLVEVKVTDDGVGHLSDSATFTWSVAEKNRPPVLDQPADAEVDELTPITFTVTATDPDGHDLRFTLKNGPGAVPGGVLLDPTSGEFYWVPAENQGPGSYTFDIVVTDSGSPTLKDRATITIDVVEVPDPNQPPDARDDSARVEEDHSVVVDVLDNDSDPEGDPFEVISASTDAGWVEVTPSGEIRYTPPPNFNGWAGFTYRVEDDHGARSTATVVVMVNNVNDAPSAGDDNYQLFSYDEASLGVLHNDYDADGDSLTVAITDQPTHGEIRTDGSRFFYTPDIGWHGTDSFTYVAADPSGATSEATVEIRLDRDALANASRLAEDLGVNDVPFAAPDPVAPIPTSLLTMQGMSLLAQAFFQTVSALRLPLSFLGVAAAMLIGFGSASRLPALLFGARQRHWSVVLRNRQQPLPVLTEPAGESVIYNFDPTTVGIASTGPHETARNKLWLPVDTPNGIGWVDREFVTEQIDLETFKEDARPTKLVNQLARRLREGEPIDSLISRRGLILALTGSPTRIPPEQLAALFGDTHVRQLYDIEGILDNRNDVLVAVTRPFLEAYEATEVVTAETPHSKTSLIPTECWNFPYLALGVGSGVQPWLVFFEYRSGKAWIAGLGVDE